MHFSKTFTQILETLPPELRDNAIQYRQLKKLIREVVHELAVLGLSPSVLQELLANASDTRSMDGTSIVSKTLTTSSRLVYEFVKDADHYEPRLRIYVASEDSHSWDKRLLLPQPELPSSKSSASIALATSLSLSQDAISSSFEKERSSSQLELTSSSAPKLEGSASDIHIVDKNASSSSLPTIDQPDYTAVVDSIRGSIPLLPDTASTSSYLKGTKEVIVPLPHDTAFFDLLSSALAALSNHLHKVQADFAQTLEDLSRTVSQSTHPPPRRAHLSSSAIMRAGGVPSSALDRLPSLGKTQKSDLYAWREIFQLYIDSEVFESLHEVDAGERSIKDSEERLQLFKQRISDRSLDDTTKMKLASSRRALRMFLDMNMLILDLKKFEFANSEATRKILKKHAKRTALPPPPFSQELMATVNVSMPSKSLIAPRTTHSLSRFLVQAIGETLIPVIPSLDDYACLICTSIAFKPIRLACRHLFCVRCLVKMQKRGQESCPMCRSPSVLVADRSNLDVALLNFMLDWFPVESKEKLRSNEQEAAKEHLEELGVDPDACVIM